MRAKDFLKEGDVIPFQQRDDRTDQEKYDDASSDQIAKRPGYDTSPSDTRSDIGKIPCPYCDDVWCNFDCDEAQAGGFDNIEEGDVIDTKFQQRLAQKRGMVHSPDAEPPLSRKDGKPFDRFEVEQSPSGNSGTIIGVRGNDYRENVGTAKLSLAHVLAGAYNAGGYSTQSIKNVPLGDLFK